MPMSKRRFQFLNQLVELYQKTRLPIHYETLAKAVGVSKWTAYDMLKEIEKSGYVMRSYEVNPNETGRSQVMFTPTDKATDLFKQKCSNAQENENWEESAQSIRKLIHDLKHANVQNLLQKMLDDMPNRRSNLEFCGYILGILIVYLKKVGGKTESVIQLLISKTSSHHTSLLIFVGTVLGTVIQTMSDEISSGMTDLVGEYLGMISNLSNGEQKLLSDFIKEALA
ncbi:MarR family transcriptional regulator [Paenibacillus sp. FSL W8-0194]|uniref:MarR family transcriptional regulator n=1 Tax=Paenibacillus sp. FSL W8-0194 TaxID=2921711 RepID=UPI0030DD0200